METLKTILDEAVSQPLGVHAVVDGLLYQQESRIRAFRLALASYQAAVFAGAKAEAIDGEYQALMSLVNEWLLSVVGARASIQSVAQIAAANEQRH